MLSLSCLPPNNYNFLEIQTAFPPMPSEFQSRKPLPPSEFQDAARDNYGIDIFWNHPSLFALVIVTCTSTACAIVLYTFPSSCMERKFKTNQQTSLGYS